MASCPQNVLREPGLACRWSELCNPPGFSVNDEPAGGRRVLNPNDDGGVDGLRQGTHHGQRHVPVMIEEFAVELIPDVRQRLSVALVI